MKKIFLIFVFCILFFISGIYVFASSSDTVNSSLDDYYYITNKGVKYYFRYVYSSIFESDSIWGISEGSTVDSIFLTSSDSRPLSYSIYFNDKLYSPSIAPSGSSISVSSAEMKSGITLDVPSDTLSVYIVANTGTNNYSGITVSSSLNYTAPVPSPTPTPAPTLAPTPTAAPLPSGAPEPTPDDDLLSHDWSMVCYELQVPKSYTATLPMTARFVPYDSSVFDQEHITNDSTMSIHEQRFSYRVKIPFRFTCFDFDGVGKFDTHISFDADISTYIGNDDTIKATYDYSIPWIETSDSSVSFDATAPGGGWPTGIDLLNATIVSGESPVYYYCFDCNVSLQSAAMMGNFGKFLTVVLNNLRFDLKDARVESYKLPSEILQDIDKGIHDTNDTIKQEHQEEIDKSNEAVDKVTGGVDELTGTLSSWQIFTMPVTLITDFVGAISSDGNTGFTFPSFNLMGQELWPSYTFDLQVIAEKFPLLYNSLHIISGILIVISFVRYCWRKWHVLTGDDLPEGEDK